MDLERFKVNGDREIRLRDFPTKFDAGKDDDDLDDIRRDVWSDLGDLQQKLYAQSKQSILIVLQAMDAAGKDSTIAKLTKSMDSHSCHVHSFKKPSELELAQDFLWRIHKAAPAAGDITLFNRSHYEDVLIVKVHEWVSEKTIEARYDHINNFERLLADRGTHVIKIMLNISPEYQLGRFKRRLDNPGKHWKFNPGDLDERNLWDDYMEAFEIAINRCSSQESPWYIVPAENRRYRDALIASIVRDKLLEIDPQYPQPEFDEKRYTSDSIS